MRSWAALAGTANIADATCAERISTGIEIFWP